ncbi:MAG: hypothetical protein WA705_24575 [Candidatus Ozemobacteraceae bacterium]
MEKRRYSIQDIQRMTQLSPATLQDLLKRYRQHFAIEVVDGPTGEEMFMDQPSFERLMFIKQLELRQNLSPEETMTQIGDSQLRMPSMPVTGGSVATGESVGEKDSELPSLSSSGLRMGSLLGSLDRLGGEIHVVEGSLHQLLLRYSQVLRDMNQYREENRQLRRDMDTLRQRQNVMLGKMRLIDGEEDEDAGKKPQIN